MHALTDLGMAAGNVVHLAQSSNILKTKIVVVCVSNEPLTPLCT